jgi:PAS domain S-box-containing protein
MQFQAPQTTPGWTLPGVPSLVVLALLAIATAFVWAIVLRRQVRRQMRALAARQREDAALRQQYEEIFENASDMIYTHDADGRFVSINRAGERLAGYTRQQCELLTIYDLIADDDRERVRAQIHASIAKRQPAAFRAHLRSREGRDVPVEIHARPVSSGEGPVTVEGVARDLTERERFEQSLREATKMEAVGQLAAGIAHDFNNLLTIVLAYSDFIATRVGDDPDAQSAVAEVQKAAARASALTSEMLAFGRRQFLTPTLLDLNDVIRDLMPLLDGAMGAEIDLSVRLVDEPLPVRLDRARLEQAIVNVATNARDAMPGGGRLVIATSTWRITDDEDPGEVEPLALPPGIYARVVVSDTGVGMSPEALEHVFEPFYTTKTVGGGPGLGLAMTYGFAKQSGGSIAIRSTPGTGTTVELLFPLNAARAEPPSLRDRVVLIAEDDPPVRRLIADALRKQGAIILEASDGEQAKAIVEQHEGPIDLLLSDLKMPRMGGTELARWLAFARPGVRVLFMSGYAAPGAVTGGQFGLQAFIQKPFAREDLIRRLQDLLAASDATTVERTTDPSTS